jgi:hypothetical protein
MNKINKLTAALVATMSPLMAQAGSFDALTSESIGVEAATTGSLEVDQGIDQIVLTTGTAYAANDRLVISLSNGATFGDSTYRLEQSTGGIGNGDLTEFLLTTASPDGESSIEFRAASAVADGAQFILVGSSAVDDVVTVVVPALTAGAKVNLDAEARDVIGIYDNFAAIELFRYANEFSAALDLTADAEVDVNEGRLEFVTGVTDRIALNFTATRPGTFNGVSLNDSDKLEVVLSGNMAGIETITASTDAGTSRGTATIDTVAGTATFEFSASDALAGTGSAILDIAVDETTVLATREFTIQADLDFQTEVDKNLVAAGTAAGEWTINGLQAKVSHLSLNTTGFVSWLKVMNTGAIPVQVYGDIIYTLADGTEGSVDAALLGSVDAGGVGTVSEATILAAMGNPTQLADVHITVTVTGQDDAVHLTAEKKASDGRMSVPVYYNDGSTRNWFQ